MKWQERVEGVRDGKREREKEKEDEGQKSV